jgi:hypothetical protein
MNGEVILKNSKPISLDNLLNYSDQTFIDVAAEIEKVIQKVKPIYIGKDSDGDLALVDEKNKEWGAWVLVDDTVYGDVDYYKPRSWNAMALRLFPKLVKFINELPIEGLGRAIIMSIDANKEVTTHIDNQFLDNQEVFDYDRLLNISFGNTKRLYMYNPDTNTKKYFEGKINWIDVSDYHGVDTSADFTYSVRVDAKLNKDFRQLVRDKYGV